MDREEIKKLIEQEKEMIAEFQKLAHEHKLSEEMIEQQINFYLDTLNELEKMLKDLE